MTDNESFYHVIKKLHEELSLLFKHFIPQGKSYPESYNDHFLWLWKGYKAGVFDNLIGEPIEEEEIKKLDVLQYVLFPQEQMTESHKSLNGMDVDLEEAKTP